MMRLVLILSGLAVVGAVVGWFAVSISLTGEQVITPDIRGLPLVEALRLTEEQNLFLRLEGESYDATIAAQCIITQRPAAGMMIKKGRQISVVVSKGIKGVVVPDLTDRPWRELNSMLTRSGLQQGTVARVHSAAFSRDRIISQQPMPGKPASQGEKVDVLVSLGQAAIYYVTPDWISKPIDIVQHSMVGMNLRLEITEQRIIASLPDGTVIDQQPRPGFRIRAGDIVRIVVSRRSDPEQKLESETVPFSFLVPVGMYPKELRILLLAGKDRKNEKEIYRREVMPGENIQLNVPREPDALLEIYLNDELVARTSITLRESE